MRRYFFGEFFLINIVLAPMFGGFYYIIGGLVLRSALTGTNDFRNSVLMAPLIIPGSMLGGIIFGFLPALLHAVLVNLVSSGIRSKSWLLILAPAIGALSQFVVWKFVWSGIRVKIELPMSKHELLALIGFMSIGAFAASCGALYARWVRIPPFDLP